MNDLLSIRALSKSFTLATRQVTALQDINFSIGKGAFVALVGASGCGKSTLLRLVAGLETPDAGSIQLADAAVTGPSQDCGMIFQDPRLLPWLTVAQNVDLALSNQKLDAARRKELVAEHLDLVGLGGFANAFPRQLSGGMAQRAAIARGLVNRPSLLLLDEPFSALDSFTRTRLQGELQQIWMLERIAMVMVTHDVQEAVYLADRVVVLESNPGRINSIVEVNLPRPRDRNAAAFVAVKADILQQLESYAQAA